MPRLSPPRRKQLEDRKERILKLRSEGYSYSEVAKAVGVTSQRVHQIVNDTKEVA